MTRAWPHLRAGLIGLAIAIGLLDGCPMPNAKQRKNLDPAIAGALTSLDRVRHHALRPLRPIKKAAHVTQRWNLFRSADRDRYRMWIEGRTGAGEPWELLYRVNDDDHDLLADQLAYRRMRGSWTPRGTRGPRGAYRSFVNWVAAEIFARRPNLVEVRVQMEKVRIGPRGGNTMTGEFEYAQTRRRGEVAR